MMPTTLLPILDACLSAPFIDVVRSLTIFMQFNLSHVSCTKHALILSASTVALDVTCAYQAWEWQRPILHEKLRFLKFLHAVFLIFFTTHIGNVSFLTRHNTASHLISCKIYSYASVTMCFHVLIPELNVHLLKSWKIDQIWINSCFRCYVFNFY